MINSTYVIIPTVDITDEMVEQSVNEPATIRYSVDGSKALLKFTTPFPSSTKGYIKYTHIQILQQLAQAEWSVI